MISCRRLSGAADTVLASIEASYFPFSCRADFVMQRQTAVPVHLLKEADTVVCVFPLTFMEQYLGSRPHCQLYLNVWDALYFRSYCQPLGSKQHVQIPLYIILTV